MWTWVVSENDNTVDEAGSTSQFRYNGLVVQQWKCVTKWELLSDTVMILSSWNENMHFGDGYQKNSGTGLLSYHEDFVEWKRTGSVEHNSVTETRSPEEAIPAAFDPMFVAAPVLAAGFDVDSVAKSYKKWNGSSEHFESESYDSRSTTTRDTQLFRKSTFNESTFNELERSPMGGYSLRYSAVESLATDQTFGESGTTVGESTTNNSSFQSATLATSKQVKRTREFFEGGLPKKIAFEYFEEGPGLDFSGSSSLTVREAPFGREKFSAQSNQVGEVELDWSAAGEITQAITEEDRTMWDAVRSSLSTWGDSTPWPALPPRTTP